MKHCWHPEIAYGDVEQCCFCGVLHHGPFYPVMELCGARKPPEPPEIRRTQAPPLDLVRCDVCQHSLLLSDLVEAELCAGNQYIVAKIKGHGDCVLRRAQDARNLLVQDTPSGT